MPAGDSGADRRLEVFAAASLAEPFVELADAYEQAHPGVDVVLHLGGSSALREQILDGAPADVFASASEPIMDELVAAGSIRGTPAPFASNRLALAVPVGNPAAVTGLDDLARPELLVGLCAAEVPCGRLARVGLERAGVDPSIDTDEPDVRTLLTKVAAGELDVGMVYHSDIAASVRPGDGSPSAPEVEGITIPDEAQASTTYPIGIVTDPDDGRTLAEAGRFVAFVLSEPGQAVLAEHGFGQP